MTTEEKAALIAHCEFMISEHIKYGGCSDDMQIYRIALAALTAEPVAYTAQENIDGFGQTVGYMWPPGNEKPSDVALYKCAPVVVPEGWKLVPENLTAENGAKAALLGEFTETISTGCTECFGDEDCDNCGGDGVIRIEAKVSWTTIKAIWSKAIEHFESTKAP